MKTLLMSIGASPQIVTETLHGLWHQQTPWWPEQLILITTAPGAALIHSGGGRGALHPLLGPNGRLQALCDSLGGLPPPQVTVDVPNGPDGSPIVDIRSAQEVEAFADHILHRIETLATSDATSLHVSLAGGRKTMSFLVGQTMSLLGRPDDRLSHVLVEPASLEQDPDFWWPGDGSRGAENAVVTLHDVPFLRLGAWMDTRQFLQGARTFHEAVRQANAAMAASSLMVDLAGGTACLGDTHVRLPPAELGILALMAIARRRGVALQVTTGWNPADRSQRGLALGGNRKAASSLWAWLAAASRLDSLAREAALVSHHRFDAQVALLAAQFDYDTHIGPPLSRLRRRLKAQLPPGLAGRIIAPRRLELLLAPERVVVHAPSDLADHPDAPPELRFHHKG